MRKWVAYRVMSRAKGISALILADTQDTLNDIYNALGVEPLLGKATDSGNYYRIYENGTYVGIARKVVEL